MITTQNQFCWYRWSLGVFFGCNDSSVSLHVRFKEVIKKVLHFYIALFLRGAILRHHFALPFCWTTNCLLPLGLRLPACLLCSRSLACFCVKSVIMTLFSLPFMWSTLYLCIKWAQTCSTFPLALPLPLPLSHAKLNTYIKNTKK